MKSEWKIMKASEFIDFNPKISLKKGTSAKKIAMDKLMPFTKKVSGYEIASYSGGTKFCNGDTIMARITPCLENGKTAYVDFLEEGEIAFGSTEFIVMRAKEGISDSQFIYYLSISPYFREIAIKSMVGSSGRQRVQQSVLEELELLMPPLEEQEKIGQFLKKIDDKIALNQQINNNLEQQAQAIYQQMFTDNVELEKWEKGILGDIADITMGQSPKGTSYNENNVGTVFFQGRAEFGHRFPTIRLYTTEPKRMANSNDVLMSVRAPVGDINVAHEKCCIGRGLAAIRSKGNYQSFMLYTMYALKDQLDIFNGEGTVFGSINKKALNDLPVFLPHTAKIEEFENIVDPIDRIIRNNYDEICYLEKIRDFLLSKLMSGECRIK